MCMCVYVLICECVWLCVCECGCGGMGASVCLGLIVLYGCACGFWCGRADIVLSCIQCNVWIVLFI